MRSMEDQSGLFELVGRVHGAAQDQTLWSARALRR